LLNLSFTYKTFSQNLLSDVESDIKTKIESMDLENTALEEEMAKEAQSILTIIETHKTNISNMS